MAIISNKLSLALILGLAIKFGNAQSPHKSIMLNLSTIISLPKIRFDNNDAFSKVIPSFGFSLSKELVKKRRFSVITSIGFTRNLFEAKREFTRQSIPFLEKRRVNLSYLFLEGGVALHYPRILNGSFSSTLAMRANRIIYEDDYFFNFPELGNFDYGTCLKVNYTVKKSLFQISYYHGFSVLAKNSIVISGVGTSESYLKNRSIEITLGRRLITSNRNGPEKL